MKRVFLLAGALILCGGAVLAAQNQRRDPAKIQQKTVEATNSWVEAKARLGELANQHKCDEYWHILWPHAKEGNLEARSYLVLLMAPPPDIAPVFPPGNSGDYISKARDIVILSVHSHGANDRLDHGPYAQVARALYRQVGFDSVPAGRDYLKCLDDAAAGDCTAIAVEGKLVPSFKEYAEQVDAMMAQGMQSTCASGLE